MALTAEQVPIIMAAGAAALGLAALLWALRVSDGARGAARKYRDRSAELETTLAAHRSILGAHPGVILVWQGEALEAEGDDIIPPEMYGSPVALAGLLSFTDDAISPDPAVRIIEASLTSKPATVPARTRLSASACASCARRGRPSR
jgi:hypothetical protein